MHKIGKVPSSYVNFSIHVWFIILFAAGTGLFSPNPSITVASILSLPCFVALLWRRGEPAVLFFTVAIQWLEVTLKVFHANATGISVEALNLTMFPDVIEAKRAIGLGLIGLLVMAFGMRLGMRGMGVLESQRLRQDAAGFSLNRLWIAYLISVALSIWLSMMSQKIYYLKQVFLTLANFRWVIFFILAYTVMYKRQKGIYLVLATLYEILAGFTGYFSKFTYVLFVLFLAITGIGYRPTYKNTIKLVLIIGMGVFLASCWLAIRDEYRNFLNLGTKQQIILVSLKERFEKLGELFTATRGEDLRRGFNLLLARIAYVDMFGHVLKYVPEFVPHQRGLLWNHAIQHVIAPRLFFPEKPSLPSDSEMTMKFTGLRMASGEEGTSISMGYMAESYIDFGIPGMFVPVLLLGFLWGFIFRFLVLNVQPRIFGYALSVVVLIDTLGFGSNNVKLLGGVLTGLIVMAVASKFIVPLIYRSLTLSRR